MPKPMNKEQRAARLALVKRRVAEGFYATQIAKELGVSRAAVSIFMSYHGIKSKHGKGWPKGRPRSRPTTTAGRLAARQTTYNLGSKTETWQTADPNQFPDDIITEAQRMLRCDQRHAAWLLSCPRGGNAHGWRGGSAIG